MEATSTMDTSLEPTTLYLEGESVELWSPSLTEFSCQPDDIKRYIAVERWDLVFNALCYLTGFVDEGTA